MSILKLLAGKSVWIVGYVLLVSLMTIGIVEARGRALRAYSSTTARSDWDTWRDHANRQAQPGAGPVLRRPRVNREPPALVLMREYFLACLAFALIIASAVYGSLVVLVRGALSTDGRKSEQGSR